MRGRQDENWLARHAQWINIWNNRRELTLTGQPMQGPLFHTREYMDWYIANSIYFLSVPHLLQDPRTPHQRRTSTHQRRTSPHQRRTSTTFETGTSSTPYEDTDQHVSYPPQNITPQPNIIDRRHSFATGSEDFYTNLFGVDMQTPSSAQSYMQSLYQPDFLNAPGSASAAVRPPVIDEDPNPQQIPPNPEQQSPQRRNPARNRRRPRCGTGPHYGD